MAKSPIDPIDGGFWWDYLISQWLGGSVRNGCCFFPLLNEFRSQGATKSSPKSYLQFGVATMIISSACSSYVASIHSCSERYHPPTPWKALIPILEICPSSNDSPLRLVHFCCSFCLNQSNYYRKPPTQLSIYESSCYHSWLVVWNIFYFPIYWE